MKKAILLSMLLGLNTLSVSAAKPNTDHLMFPEDVSAAMSNYADDSMITAEAKAVLVEEDTIQAMKISVETNEGEVILSGFVDSHYEKNLAEQLVEEVDGVNEVVNSLVVES